MGEALHQVTARRGGGVLRFAPVVLGLGDLRESAGAGLRFETPIGPIRLEYGWKLDRREGASDGEAHLAIGAVF